MLRIIIVESNSPELLINTASRGQLSDSDSYKNALLACQPMLDIKIVYPYSDGFDLDKLSLALFDGAVFTGSSVNWSVDAPEAKVLRDTMKKIFSQGIPTLASCNGMQLAAVLLGGKVISSPNGRELGMALNIRLTNEGKKHAIHKGRENNFACSCVHRDEVSKLPLGATLTATNDHSKVQAFIYEKNGIIFWGMQYHPELQPTRIAELIEGDGLFNGDPKLAFHLKAIAKSSCNRSLNYLGVKPSDLIPNMHMREIYNWLNMIEESRK